MTLDTSLKDRHHSKGSSIARICFRKICNILYLDNFDTFSDDSSSFRFCQCSTENGAFVFDFVIFAVVVLFML